MKTPKISVLTPIYNTNPENLRSCIESVLNQTYTDFEFLILNDSPDNKEIEKIVKDYAKKDKRIKYYKNEKNIGISASRNKLLNLAKGEYIAVCDHDDISLPDRFKLEVQLLDKYNHIGVVGGNMVEMSRDKELSKTDVPLYDNDIKLALINIPHVLYPIHPTSMIRKSVLIKSGARYNENWSPCEDHALWLDLIDHTCFHNLKDVVLKYSWHEDNTTLKHWQKMYDLPWCMIMQARQRFPMYYEQWKDNEYNKKNYKSARIRTIYLFGFIPLFKIKINSNKAKIYLFNYIPIMKIKRRWL